MNLYVTERVSTTKNQDIESQRFGNQRYIESNDLIVTRTFSENVSGRKVPISDRLLGEIKKLCKRGDSILGYDQSRFARNQREWLNFVWWAQDIGVEIIVAENGLKFGFGHDDLGTNAMSFFKSAETEATAVMTAKKTKDALALRKQKIADKEKEIGGGEGYFITNDGNKCYGLGNRTNLAEAGERGREVNRQRWESRLRENTEMKKAWAIIVRMKDDGETNVYVAGFLNSNGYRTATNKEWLPSGLSAFIKRGAKVW